MKLTGKIIHGQSRGKGMGFPTLNIDTQSDIEHGVYAVWVVLGENRFAGVMNFGSRPTFDEKEAIAEIHLLKFDADIYGEEVEVLLVSRLRGVQKFEGEEELIAQIKSDIEEAKCLLL